MAFKAFTAIRSALSRVPNVVKGVKGGNGTSGVSALAAAVLVLGTSLILLGIVVQSWLCQALGTACVVLSVSWAIKALLPPTPTPTRTRTPSRAGGDSPDRP